MADVLEVLKYVGIGILIVGFVVFCIKDSVRKFERMGHF
jgi:preprotein translocase subunit Sss1